VTIADVRWMRVLDAPLDRRAHAYLRVPGALLPLCPAAYRLQNAKTAMAPCQPPPLLEECSACAKKLRELK
jgi:hypothetical protein